VAFIDEIFKANSAILNALLTLLNERLFDNGNQRLEVPLLCLVSLTALLHSPILCWMVLLVPFWWHDKASLGSVWRPTPHGFHIKCWMHFMVLVVASWGHDNACW